MTQDDSARFSGIFDRAVAACAQAQLLSARCAATALRARQARLTATRIRLLAAQTRDAWRTADRVFDVMRREVEGVGGEMRDAGWDVRDAAAAVRARVRFVLYDGGLREQEVEPVVERASAWVEQLYDAA
jgi:hypothetical protein